MVGLGQKNAIIGAMRTAEYILILQRTEVIQDQLLVFDLLVMVTDCLDPLYVCLT